MSSDRPAPADPDFRLYVCPNCRAPLQVGHASLDCHACKLTYPIVDGIPDFILEDLSHSPHPLLRWVDSYYRQHAGLYEWTRFPLRHFLYGGFHYLPFTKMLRILQDILGQDKGLILDIACGPGTLGRRLASSTEAVYGIDLSMAMLRQGQKSLTRKGPANVRLARARVEALPFEDGRFEAAVCGAAMQLFLDPVDALREVGRTLKPGAPLAVTTIIAGRDGIYRFRRMRERARRFKFHLFELEGLERIVAEAGFVGFQPQVYGSMVLFQARKRPI